MVQGISGNFRGGGLKCRVIFMVALCMLLFVVALPAYAANLVHNSTNLPNPANPKWGGNWGVPGGQYGEFTCMTCHTRSTNNIKRIVETIPANIGPAVTKSVYFRNTTGFGNDAGGHSTSTHICEVCHTITAVHKYNTAGQTDFNHEGANNTDCVACHAHRTAFAASCTKCHGGDADSDSLMTTGKHANHLDPVTNPSLGSPLGCVECHAKTVQVNHSVSNPTYHRNNFADYSGVRAGKSTTYSSATGVCSSVYCHSDGKGTLKSMTADNWKASTTLGCTGCHGSNTGTGTFASVAGEPNYSNLGSGVPRANSHQKHVDTIGASTCVYCHSTTTTTGLVINTNTTTHADGTLTVVAGGGKSFSWTAKTCSTISCHATAGTTAFPATWGATLDCKGCHGSDKASGTPISTGKHSAHIDTASNVSLGTAFGCVECHAKTVSNNTTISNASNHAKNQFVDYSGVRAGKSTNYSSSTGVCSSVYCHSDGKGTVKSMTSNTWKGATTLDCKGCHGSDTAAGFFTGVAGEPNYSNFGSGAPRANSHSKHVTTVGAASCTYCHSTTTTTGTTIVAGSTQHVDGTINVVAGGGKTFTWAAKTCTNISCHATPTTSSYQATWGATLDCKGCHGSDKASGTPITTGKHTSHIDTATNTSLGTAFGCVECHSKTVSNNTTISTAANHATGFVDYSGVRAGRSTNYNSSTGVCSSVYCHSDGKGTVKSMTTDTWKAATTLDCKGCHGSDTATGFFAGVAGEPNYSNFGSGAPKANSHQKHVTTTGAATCVYCHSTTTTTGTSIIAGSTQHINGTNTVVAGGGKTFTWSAKTCSTVSCHATATTTAFPATWGAALDCKGCHGSDKASGTPITTGKHTSHIDTAANVSLGTAIGCVECHSKTVSSNTVVSNSANHVTGFVDYSGARAGRSTNYSTATGICANVYCHSDGKGTTKSMTADNWKASTTLTCTSCHGSAASPAFTSVGQPNYSNTGANTPRANSHYKHVTQNGGTASCVNCHSATTTTGTSIIAGSTSHADGNITLVPGNGRNFTISSWSANKTCSTISCHNNGNATWGETLYCNDCHIMNTGAHAKHSGAVNLAAVSFYAYTSNVTPAGAGTTYGFGCANCHPTDPANHMNSSVQVDLVGQTVGGVKLAAVGSIKGKNPSTAAWTGTKCNNIYCHSDGFNAPTTGTVNWTDTFVGLGGDRCAKCHGNSPTTGAHDHHIVGIHYNDIFSGAVGKLAVGSTGSVSHGIAAQSTTINCDMCHQNTVNVGYNDQNTICKTCHKAGGPGALKGDSTITNLKGHVNGSVEVAFKDTLITSKAQMRDTAFDGYSGVWTRPNTYKNSPTAYDVSKKSLNTASWTIGGTAGTSSCSAVVCHNGNTVLWNDPGTCETCHKKL